LALRRNGGTSITARAKRSTSENTSPMTAEPSGGERGETSRTGLVGSNPSIAADKAAGRFRGPRASRWRKTTT